MNFLTAALFCAVTILSFQPEAFKENMHRYVVPKDAKIDIIKDAATGEHNLVLKEVFSREASGDLVQLMAMNAFQNLKEKHIR